MILFLCIVFTVIWFFLVLWAVRRVQRRARRRVHLMGPLTFPLPTDDRWTFGVAYDRETYTLGSVMCVVIPESSLGLLYVNDVRVTKVLYSEQVKEDAYVMAVKRAYKEKHPNVPVPTIASLRTRKLALLATELEKLSRSSSRSEQ